jgi:hypothetical protein
MTTFAKDNQFGIGMKKLFYLAAVACMALLASCEKEGVTHTGDDTGNLYGVWALTTKTVTSLSSDGTNSTKETDYTENHFYLALGEFPFPHALVKKGSFTDLDLKDVDVDATRFTYNSQEKKISFSKTLWLSDDLLSRNMILGGTFDVTKLGKTELVLTQKVGTVTTVYSYKKQN